MDVDNFLEQLKEKLKNENIVENTEDLSLDKFSTFGTEGDGEKVEVSTQSSSYWTYLIPIIEAQQQLLESYISQCENLVLKVADLEMQIAEIKQKMEAA